MGLALAIAVALLTLALSGCICFANGMSDSPSTRMSVRPWFIGGMAVAVLLALSHYFPLHVTW